MIVLDISPSYFFVQPSRVVLAILHLMASSLLLAGETNALRLVYLFSSLLLKDIFSGHMNICISSCTTVSIDVFVLSSSETVLERASLLFSPLYYCSFACVLFEKEKTIQFGSRTPSLRMARVRTQFTFAPRNHRIGDETPSLILAFDKDLMRYGGVG